MSEHSAEHGPESGRPQDFNEQPGLIAAGGWCAQTSALYDAESLRSTFGELVTFEVPKIELFRPGTPEYDARQREVEHQRLVEQSTQRIIYRLVGNLRDAQDEALTRAYFAAEAAGMDILWEDPPLHHTMWRWNRHGDLAAYRFIGLSLVERPNEHWRRLQPNVPIILRETARRDDYYDEDY